MAQHFFKIAITLGIMTLSLNLEAKLFRNAYVSFELPEATWNCSLEQTEWVCRSNDPKSSREAIIILTAKEVGPTDSFDAYNRHLSTSQPTAYKGQTGGKSKVVYPSKQVQINDHPWVDGLQLASEVPNYYTRYIATIKDQIAVLVTLSAHSDHYTKYSKDFFKTVQSLRVIATKNLLANPEMGPLRPSGETLGGSLSAVIPNDLLLGESDGLSGAGGSSTKSLIIVLAILLAGAGAYLLLKGKKK